MIATHEWTSDIATTIDYARDDYLAQIYGIADSFGAQLEAGMLGFIGDVAEKSGQVVDGAGRDLFDTLLEATEKVEFSFDAEGKHNMMLVVPPEFVERLQGRGPTPEQQQAMDRLIERKKAEWDASRTRGELPGFTE